MSNPLDLFRLDGRVALITGAAGGLGEVFAKTLAAAGADLILVGRRQEPLDTLAEHIRQQPQQRTVTVYTADVTDNAQVEQMASAVGKVDILINSAGVNLRKPAVEYPVEKWDELIALNLSAPFYCARALAPQMLERGWGRVVNISSMLGTVGLLCPGPFATEMNRPILNNQAAYQWFIDRLPIGRWGDLRDLEGPILFLSSDASAFMTGASLVVDGGWTAQ
jgi:NAD(P)-dependent dehydrogenase (short-subunit alcohol dehydrogenase family)